MQTSAAGLAYLSATLGADAPLLALLPAGAGGLQRKQAPAGTPPPFVVLGHQSGRDTSNAYGVRLLSGELYQVVALGPDALYAQLVAIADRFDTLLQHTSGTAPDGQGGQTVIDACVREQDLDLGELVDGIAWARVGGLYRLTINA